MFCLAYLSVAQVFCVENARIWPKPIDMVDFIEKSFNDRSKNEYYGKVTRSQESYKIKSS